MSYNQWVSCTQPLPHPDVSSWRFLSCNTPNIQLYGELPPVSTKVQQRRMRLAGHCVRHDDEVANKLVLWQPTDTIRGRQKITYVDNLLQDTGLGTQVNCRQSWWTEGAGRAVCSTRGVLKDDQDDDEIVGFLATLHHNDTIKLFSWCAEQTVTCCADGECKQLQMCLQHCSLYLQHCLTTRTMQQQMRVHLI